MKDDTGQKTWICPNCKTENYATTHICVNCGVDVKEELDKLMNSTFIGRLFGGIK